MATSSFSLLIWPFWTVYPFVHFDDQHPLSSLASTGPESCAAACATGRWSQAATRRTRRQSRSPATPSKPSSSGRGQNLLLKTRSNVVSCENPQKRFQWTRELCKNPCRNSCTVLMLNKRPPIVCAAPLQPGQSTWAVLPQWHCGTVQSPAAAVWSAARHQVSTPSPQRCRSCWSVPWPLPSWPQGWWFPPQLHPERKMPLLGRFSNMAQCGTGSWPSHSRTGMPLSRLHDSGAGTHAHGKARDWNDSSRTRPSL